MINSIDPPLYEWPLIKSVMVFVAELLLLSFVIGVCTAVYLLGLF